MPHLGPHGQPDGSKSNVRIGMPHAALYPSGRVVALGIAEAVGVVVGLKPIPAKPNKNCQRANNQDQPEKYSFAAHCLASLPDALPLRRQNTASRRGVQPVRFHQLAALRRARPTESLMAARSADR